MGWRAALGQSRLRGLQFEIRDGALGMLVEEADGFSRDDFLLIVQRDDVVAIMQYDFALDRRGDGALDQVGALGAGDVVLFGVDDQGRRAHLAELAPYLLDQAVRLEDALGRQARSAGGRR